MSPNFPSLIQQYKSDKESVYNTWFINNEVVLQLSRPAIRNGGKNIKYILFSELRQHCDALCKFGDSHRIMEKIARSVS